MSPTTVRTVLRQLKKLLLSNAKLLNYKQIIKNLCLIRIESIYRKCGDETTFMYTSILQHGLCDSNSIFNNMINPTAMFIVMDYLSISTYGTMTKTENIFYCKDF